MPGLISSKQAAAIVGLKPSVLAALRHHWRGPPFFKLGGAVLHHDNKNRFDGCKLDTGSRRRCRQNRAVARLQHVAARPTNT